MKKTKLIAIGFMLLVLMVGANLFASGETECYARLGVIPNASVTATTNWSLLVPIQMNVTCDFDMNLQYIQGPAGMTFDGTTLYWTPTTSQIGQTFPVTVRLTVTYDNPYKVQVTSKTFYLSVVECPYNVVYSLCNWTVVNDRPLARVWVQNSTSCNVKTSGIVRIKLAGTSQWTQVGTWNSITMGPDSSVLVWGESYNQAEYDLWAEMTYSSYSAYPLSSCYCDNY